MKIKLPEIIEKFVEASNRHDVKSILARFSDDAVVQDEGEEVRGKKAIENWIVKTIEKYKFHFNPLNLKDEGVETVVTVEVSGTFDGSPVTLITTSPSRTGKSYHSRSNSLGFSETKRSEGCLRDISCAAGIVQPPQRFVDALSDQLELPKCTPTLWDA